MLLLLHVCLFIRMSIQAMRCLTHCLSSSAGTLIAVPNLAVGSPSSRMRSYTLERPRPSIAATWGMVSNRGSTVVMDCLRLCMATLLLVVWISPRLIHIFVIAFHSMEFLCVLGLTDCKQTCKPAKLINERAVLCLLRLLEGALKFRRFCFGQTCKTCAKPANLMYCSPCSRC